MSLVVAQSKSLSSWETELKNQLYLLREHTNGSVYVRVGEVTLIFRDCAHALNAMLVQPDEQNTDSTLSYVLGRNVHANTPEQLYDGTNAVFLRLLTGDTDPTTPPYISVAIHVG